MKEFREYITEDNKNIIYMLDDVPVDGIFTNYKKNYIGRLTLNNKTYEVFYDAELDRKLYLAINNVNQKKYCKIDAKKATLEWVIKYTDEELVLDKPIKNFILNIYNGRLFKMNQIGG